MRTIYLIEGSKGAGKSKFIYEKYRELMSRCSKMDSKNQDDWNTRMYVLQDDRTSETIILNSGSDMRCIINDFSDLLGKYPQADIIYTAIRPYENNPLLHNWMKEALHIQKDDKVIEIRL